MYRFTYCDDQIRLMLVDRKSFWDIDLEEELSPVLETLKKYGEIEGADFGVKPGVLDVVYELRGKTFKITYSVDSKRKEVKFYDFMQVSHSIDWRESLENNCFSDEASEVYIPQIGDPHKLIRTIECINSGINTSKGLGAEFGSSAKKSKDLARRGDYLARPLIAMGLASRVQSPSARGRVSEFVLTRKGLRIAQSADKETQERLFAEALLGFQPIQMIIEKTALGERELTKELIQEIITDVSLDSCGGTTNPRRASSLRRLVNWVTRWAGIPVRRKGNNGVQLYIPYIYKN